MRVRYRHDARGAQTEELEELVRQSCEPYSYENGALEDIQDRGERCVKLCASLIEVLLARGAITAADVETLLRASQSNHVMKGTLAIDEP